MAPPNAGLRSRSDPQWMLMGSPQAFLGMILLGRLRGYLGTWRVRGDFRPLRGVVLVLRAVLGLLWLCIYGSFDASEGLGDPSGLLRMQVFAARRAGSLISFREIHSGFRGGVRVVGSECVP